MAGGAGRVGRFRGDLLAADEPGEEALCGRREQGQVDAARLLVDSSIVPAKKGARRRAEARWIAVAPPASGT